MVDSDVVGLSPSVVGSFVLLACCRSAQPVHRKFLTIVLSVVRLDIPCPPCNGRASPLCLEASSWRPSTSTRCRSNGRTRPKSCRCGCSPAFYIVLMCTVFLHLRMEVRLDVRRSGFSKHLFATLALVCSLPVSRLACLGNEHSPTRKQGTGWTTIASV